MTVLDFRMLGPVEVRIDGHSIALGHAKQRCILATLLSDVGNVLSVDRIIDRVWGMDAPASVCNVVYSHIARLRKALRETDVWPGDGPLVRRPGGYTLDISPDVIDLHRFRSLARRAKTAGDAAAAAALLIESLDLWRGPAVAGTDGPWAERTRLSLERERTMARLDLCDAQMVAGRDDGVIIELTELVADNPLHEGVVRRLMLALYRGGHIAAALEQYSRTRRQLVDELGMGPGIGLSELYQRILRQDEALVCA